MIDFGREVCGLLSASEKREWLVTNGIGGYAAGTVAGLNSRRYHGLLISALQPPLARTVLLSKFDETACYDGRDYDLFTNRWASGTVEPHGYRNIERFHMEGTIPCWTFAIADALLEKRMWMQQGASTTYAQYRLSRASLPLKLTIKALVNYRDHHANTRAGRWQMRIDAVNRGLQITAFEGATPFYLLSDLAEATPTYTWYHDFSLSIEVERGIDPLDDNLHAGTFEIVLQPGETVTLVATTDTDAPLDGDEAYKLQRHHEQELIRVAKVSNDPVQEQLVLAADQFIVRRQLPDGSPGHSVIAGYPWFGDWGRDTMISLPGLTLTTGRYDIAASILRTFAQFVDQGMLPNRFPDVRETPEYNTVDATLWYFEAIRAYHQATGDVVLVRELFPTLKEIVEWHIRGTRYHIRVDPADGLLYSGEPSVQLTWMDAKIGDWVVTPRTGKAVEINALWYNALMIMGEFAHTLSEESTHYRELAARVKASFARFWNIAANCCYDVIDTPDGDDPSLRPNQLFAVSLPYCPLDQTQALAVLDVCSRILLTSHGLRSLGRDHPNYAGLYAGTPLQRDSVYHQGTVWGWLIGAFVEAHLRVHGDKHAAKSYLLPMVQQLEEHTMGSLSEIFDGDAPHDARGCFAQAWTIAEVLRAFRLVARENEE